MRKRVRRWFKMAVLFREQWQAIVNAPDQDYNLTLD